MPPRYETRLTPHTTNLLRNVPKAFSGDTLRRTLTEITANESLLHVNDLLELICENIPEEGRPQFRLEVLHAIIDVLQKMR